MHSGGMTQMIYLRFGKCLSFAVHKEFKTTTISQELKLVFKLQNKYSDIHRDDYRLIRLFLNV